MSETMEELVRRASHAATFAELWESYTADVVRGELLDAPATAWEDVVGRSLSALPSSLSTPATPRTSGQSLGRTSATPRLEMV